MILKLKKLKIKYFIKSLIVISLFLNFYFIITSKAELYDEQETIFAKIYNQYYFALDKPTLTDDEIKKTIDPQNPYQLDKEKIKKILEVKWQINKNKKTLITLFDQNQKEKNNNEDNQNTQKENIISQIMWRNLELFCGEHTHTSYMLQRIDKTISKVGNIMLAKMMVEPTTNIEELKRRQNIIKELSNNKELFEQLKNMLTNYAQIESDLLTFWDNKIFKNLFNTNFYFPPFPLNKLPNQALNLIFPNKTKEKFNQSPLALAGLSFLNDFQSLRSFLLEIQNLKIYKYDFYKQFSEFKDSFNKIKLGIKNLKNNTNRNQKTLELINLIKNSLWFFWHFDCMGYDIAQIPISGLSVFKIIEDELGKWKTLKFAHSKLKNATTVINSIIDIQKIICSNKILHKNIECTKKINFLFNGNSSNSKEFDKLINYLKTNSFKKDKKTIIFSRGKILGASYLMLKTQNKLVDILQTIGQIDAYLSLAKLYKESIEKQASFCFANYINQNQSYISIEDFWTPFIDQETVITNNIELGKTEKSRNAIISGPNAGGKSTILKSITINLLFAQTFGICPSKKLTITPFSYIDTYLNITDDISSGDSLFKSEVLRIKELLNRIKIENPKKCFVIMDEMFNGTNPLEGEAAGYAVGKYLAKLKNSITLIASHYPKMTLLEQDTNCIFKNYKVSVNKLKNNILQYPFKLEEGITNQTIAIDILEAENFSPQIIKDARSIITN